MRCVCINILVNTAAVLAVVVLILFVVSCVLVTAGCLSPMATRVDQKPCHLVRRREINVSTPVNVTVLPGVYVISTCAGCTVTEVCIAPKRTSASRVGAS